MSLQEHVPTEQTRQILQTAALRATPIAVTCRMGGVWQSFRSRFLGVRDGHPWIDRAVPATPGQPSAELAAGQKIGIAFKQRHCKYVYSTQILAVAEFPSSPDATVRGLRVDWPTDMLQFQRRMFNRVIVPTGRQAFVTFWEGGLDREPVGHMRDRLSYYGQLVDLSAGGFRVRLLGSADPGFRCGDPIGADFIIDGRASFIKLDSQFRHAIVDEFGVTLGMQIMGLVETDDGRKTLNRINRLVQEFQRSSRRHGRVRVAV